MRPCAICLTGEPASRRWPGRPRAAGSGPTRRLLDGGVRTGARSAYLDPPLMTIHVHILHAAEDVAYAGNIFVQLAELVRRKRLTLWHCGCLQPGEMIAAVRADSLARARIVLLLLSPDFLKDDALVEEGERAIDQDRQILPVLIRPTNLDGSVFGNFKSLPADGGPINSRSDANREQAFCDVAREVTRRVAALETRKASPQLAPAGAPDASVAPWPLPSTLAADTAVIARAGLREGTERVTTGMIMDPYRRLVIRFCTLPHLDQQRILIELGLSEEGDLALDEPERFGRCFERARDRGRLADLWNEVERVHPERSSMRNPFAST